MVQSLASRIALVLAGLALSFTTGCSTLKSPTTSLRSATLGEVTSDGVGVNFAVDVSNPNAVAIPLTTTSYNLAFGKAKVADGKLDPKTSIPANGTAPFTVPLHVTFDQMLGAVDAIRSSGGNVPYTFDGSFSFSGGSNPLGIPVNVPFKYSGELPLKKILSDPMVLLKSPTARRLAQEALNSYMAK